MSNKRLLWIILCFILLIALALFAYRFLTAAQNHTPPESERSVISAVSAADFTCYDAQGNQIQLADFSRQAHCFTFLGQLVPSLPGRITQLSTTLRSLWI